ncbi:MAG: hypothetical protein IKT71_08160 [Paludibacteraceae bacterium]|nr:hypothetical protein [Paludibacteraceae bacterium]
MKKFITLFMATVVATSMFALPQKSMSAKDAKASFEKAKVENPLKAKVEKKHSEKLLVRDFVPAQVKEKKALAPVKKAAAKNSVAANERDTVKLSFEEFQVGPDFYEDYEEWYVAVGNGSYGFRFDWYSADFEGTFTTDDMELEYSYGWYLDDWDEEVYVEYVEVEMTTSKKAVDEYTDLLTLDATILGDDDKVYVISATHKILKPKEIIELAIETGTMTWDADWELATLDAKNDDMEIYMEWISYWVTNPVSIYDVMDYTVKYKGEALELIGLDMTVGAVKNDEGVIGYEIYMEMLSSEPIQYNVTVFAPIESTETVEIEINNLSIDASVAYDWGWIFCDGYNDEWELSAGIDAYVMGFEMAEGTYKGVEEVMFYLTNKVTGDFTEQLYAEVVVTNDPEYGWVLNFESLCTDNKTYKVTMKKEVPVATDTVAIRFDKSANAAYYPWLDNDLLLANSNEQFYAGIDVVGVEMGGEFTMEDLDLSYSLIFSDYANRVMVEMADVKGTLYQIGDTTYIKAEVIGYDGVLYDVELWHCVPTPTETVQVEIIADFENKINTDGYYVLSGYSDNTLYVSLAPLAEEVAGTFVNDGVFSRFGEGQYDFYCDYSAIYKNVNGEAVPYSIEKCTMTVTEEEDGLIKAVATLIAADAVQYEVTMTTTYNNHLNYDAVEGAIDRTYTADDILLQEQYGEGITYLEVMAADGSDMFALYFFSEEYDSDIVIQPGTYTIDDTQDYMTVLASAGVVGNSIYPSFYGYLSENGQGIITPLYFLVGGTVEVENRDGKLYIEVNAVNSYNVPVHIVFDSTKGSTGVENISTATSATKMINNGQLVITRGGKVYNAQGAQVK